MNHRTLAVLLPASRQPGWSVVLTTPLAALIPVRRRPAALSVIKALHTVIFASVAGAIGLFLWDGLRQRRGRRAAVALGVVLTESAMYVSNNQVCPLTPLAEQLGAERGSVADIFLPDRLARRIPLVGSSALVLGLALNLRTWLGRRPMGTWASAVRPAASARDATAQN
jgi:hypothetical protein